MSTPGRRCAAAFRWRAPSSSRLVRDAQPGARLGGAACRPNAFFDPALVEVIHREQSQHASWPARRFRMQEYFDRAIRDELHFRAAVEYVEHNPLGEGRALRGAGTLAMEQPGSAGILPAWTITGLRPAAGRMPALPGNPPGKSLRGTPSRRCAYVGCSSKEDCLAVIATHLFTTTVHRLGAGAAANRRVGTYTPR